jgi:hypothetical protein
MMDFKKDPAAARGYFERFLRADREHQAQRAEAERRLKQLAPPPPAAGTGSR